MKILVTTLARNEQSIIPYFVHHYFDIADKIVIVDHESTDNTIQEALKTYNALVLRHGQKCELEILKMKNDGWDDHLSKTFKETLYKNYRNDFDIVFTLDTDELWYHKHNLRNHLEDLWKIRKERLCIKPIGIQMMSENFPEYNNEKITSIVKTGLRDPGFDKPSCFSTKLNLYAGYGMHFAKHLDTQGNVVNLLHSQEIFMLHYKLLGFDYAFDRLKSTRKNLSPIGLELANNGVGKHLIDKEENLKKGFFEAFNKCKAEGFNLENI